MCTSRYEDLVVTLLWSSGPNLKWLFRYPLLVVNSWFNGQFDEWVRIPRYSGVCPINQQLKNAPYG